LDEGRVIIEQGSIENAQLILVLKGNLKITQDPYDDDEEDSTETCLTLVHPHEIVGGLQLLTNEPSFYTISSNSPTLVAVLNSTAFAEIINIRPQIALSVAFSVLRRLSTFVRAVDFAIDWVLLDSGQAVYRQGDSAESMFVVLSGRLRSVDKTVAIEEFGRGDALGIIEVLQKKPRSTTVLAVRYSQLARIPEGLLNFVKMQFPQVIFFCHSVIRF
jgi:lysophospholipid hydrolase